MLPNNGAVIGVLTLCSICVVYADDMVREIPRLDVVASESLRRWVAVFDRAAQSAGSASLSIGDRQAEAESM